MGGLMVVLRIEIFSSDKNEATDQIEIILNQCRILNDRDDQRNAARREYRLDVCVRDDGLVPCLVQVQPKIAGNSYQGSVHWVK